MRDRTDPTLAAGRRFGRSTHQRASDRIEGTGHTLGLRTLRSVVHDPPRSSCGTLGRRQWLTAAPDGCWGPIVGVDPSMGTDWPFDLPEWHVRHPKDRLPAVSTPRARRSLGWREDSW